MEYFADLHIHSCLSPCGDEDMTPANICGMAKLKGLDAIAICDHNSARNLPAAQELCDAYGLLLLPGMEITTREEVHLLGYFETVEAALAFGEMLRGHLPNKKNKPQFFGRQLVMNSDDEIIDEEEALLIGATDLPLAEATAQVTAFGGVPVPAHINRGANGLLINLGLMRFGGCCLAMKARCAGGMCCIPPTRTTWATSRSASMRCACARAPQARYWPG